MLKFIWKHTRYNRSVLEINRTKFNAIMADTFFKRIIGLMYRDRIKQNECMFFIFPTKSRYGIWMHNMVFSIDVVWFDDNMCVVDLKKSLKPCSSILKCKTYKPISKSKFIVEFNSKIIDRYKIKIGNMAYLKY